jgi:hypothetical protein
MQFSFQIREQAGMPNGLTPLDPPSPVRPGRGLGGGAYHTERVARFLSERTCCGPRKPRPCKSGLNKIKREFDPGHP